jgi:hypothetical protein
MKAYKCHECCLESIFRLKVGVTSPSLTRETALGDTDQMTSTGHVPRLSMSRELATYSSA